MKTALSDIHLRRSELWLIFIASMVFKSCSSLCRNDLWWLTEQVVNVVLLTRAALVTRSCYMMESLLHQRLLYIPCLVSLNVVVGMSGGVKIKVSLVLHCS